jgi:hypothetical protein
MRRKPPGLRLAAAKLSVAKRMRPSQMSAKLRI